MRDNDEQSEKTPIIQSKLLRHLAVLIFFSSFAGIFFHMHDVLNSGTVVGTASVVSSEKHSADESLSKYLREYQYAKFTFSPVELSPDMKDIKISLMTIRSGLRVKADTIGMENFKKLKLPLFILTDNASGQEVWRNTSTRKVIESKKEAAGFSYGYSTTDTDYGFHSEGTMKVGTKKTYYYSLGQMAVPAASSYSLVADNILMRTDMFNIFNQNPKDLTVEFKIGAKEFQVEYLIYALGGVVGSALVMALTKPRRTSKIRRKGESNE